MKINFNFEKTIGKVKPMHAVGQPPFGDGDFGIDNSMFHYLQLKTAIRVRVRFRLLLLNIRHFKKGRIITDFSGACSILQKMRTETSFSQIWSLP